MNWDLQTIFRFLLFIAVGGVLLLAITVLAEFLVPLIALAIFLIIAYLVYRFFTTGTISL